MIAVNTIEAWQAAAIMPVMHAAFDPALGEAWTLPQMREAMIVPGTHLFVAGAREIPVGFALSRTIFDATELLLLAVDPAHQRSGVGRDLVTGLIAHARAANVAAVFVEVRADNAARRFYTQLGFNEIGHRKNYYRRASGDYSDAVTMALQLQDPGFADTCAR
jgi:[ribosomal protein S18]-alanine N-acetyltransferase